MDQTDSISVLGMKTGVLMLVSSIVVGGIVLIIKYFAARFYKQNNKYISRPEDIKNSVETINPLKDQSENRGLPTSNNGGTNNPTSSGKRAKNKKRREAQQEFTHSWMVGALKGHTGPVLDMNFSSNGKFLASCAEDCDLVPEEELDIGDASSGDVEYTSMTSSSTPSSSSGSCSSSSPSPNGSISNPLSNTSSMSSKKSSSSSSSSSSKVRSDGSSPPKDRTSLSRRQRKNRTRVPRDQQRRDDENDDESSNPSQHHRHHRHHEELNVRNFPQENRTINKNSEALSKNRKNHQSSKSNLKTDSKISNESNNSLKKKYVDKINDNNVKVSSQRDELNHLSDAALASLMRRYTLTDMQLAHLGYPVECNYFPGYAIILNHQQHPTGYRNKNNQHNLDANAREFIPSTNITTCWNQTESELDSGNGSGSSDFEPESSSDSDKNSDIGESSSSSSSSSSGYEKSRRDSRSSSESWDSPNCYSIVERPCVRCHKIFKVNRQTGKYKNDEKCIYHWGKLRNCHDRNEIYKWECCKGRKESIGCTTAKMHVWTGLCPGYNGPFEGYVRTKPSRIVARDGNYGVYALDCEMCFTIRGLELAKVTLVSINGSIVYDTLVKPDYDVIDYNTRFSGITSKILSKATKNLRDVQNDIMSFVHAETIIIGHGLENDLRALKILHNTVIDTCVAFPHFLGYPFRTSLKTLARTVLKKDIQVTEHDSVEDARIAVDLMLRRLQHDLY